MNEEGKGRPALAVVVLLVLLAAFAALIFVQLFVIGRFYFYSAALGIVPFGAAWRVAYPPTTGDRPTIIDRSATVPRTPVPLGKRLT